MDRASLFLVAALVSCGGKQKQTNLAPLPADKPAEEAKTEEKKPEAPAEPKPLPPLEVKVDVPDVTVKLVNGGKGKKAPLRYTAKVGNKQPIELVMRFAQTATLGGKSDEQIVPTIVLAGEAETKAVDANGKADYALAVAATDARDEGRDVAVPVDKFKIALASLKGLVISGSLEATGLTKETLLRIEKPDPLSAGALDLIKITLPMWPVLPTEAIGVGAKWQTTRNMTLKAAPGDAGIEMVHVTDYELVAHAGTTWTIKSKTTVSGKDQDYRGGKISKIAGTGTSEIKLDDGALYPSATSSIETSLVATEGDQSMQLAFKIGGDVCKSPCPVAPAMKKDIAPQKDVTMPKR